MGFDGEPAEKIEHILTNPTTRTCSKVVGKKELGNIIWVGRYCQNLYNRGRAENFPIHGPGHVTSRADIEKYASLQGMILKNMPPCRAAY